MKTTLFIMAAGLVALQRGKAHAAGVLEAGFSQARGLAVGAVEALNVNVNNEVRDRKEAAKGDPNSGLATNFKLTLGDKAVTLAYEGSEEKDGGNGGGGGPATITTYKYKGDGYSMRIIYDSGNAEVPFEFSVGVYKGDAKVVSKSFPSENGRTGTDPKLASGEVIPIGPKASIQKASGEEAGKGSARPELATNFALRIGDRDVTLAYHGSEEEDGGDGGGGGPVTVTTYNYSGGGYSMRIVYDSGNAEVPSEFSVSLRRGETEVASRRYPSRDGRTGADPGFASGNRIVIGTTTVDERQVEVSIQSAAR